MKGTLRQIRLARLLCPLLLAGANHGQAQGIPEPSLVMYGRVLNVNSNANLRLAYGTLSCTFRPAGGGSAITAATTLTNINNQFSYVLRIPCERPVTGFPASTNAIQLTAAGITFNRSQISWNGNLVSFAQPALTNTSFFANDRGRIERVDLAVSTVNAPRSDVTVTVSGAREGDTNLFVVFPANAFWTFTSCRICRPARARVSKPWMSAITSSRSRLGCG